MTCAGHRWLIDMEDSAAVVLKRALELDLASRFQESLICYQEGIDLLLSVLKGECFVFPPKNKEMHWLVRCHISDSGSRKKNFVCLEHAQRWIAYERGNPNYKASLSLKGEDLHLICSPCLVFKKFGGFNAKGVLSPPVELGLIKIFLPCICLGTSNSVDGPLPAPRLIILIVNLQYAYAGIDPFPDSGFTRNNILFNVLSF